MTIRSNPPGAIVYVSNEAIGTTPVSHDFTYYGTRQIRLVKDGYETLTVMQPNPAPWYQIPPLDFFSEVVVPTEIRDHRTFDYPLVPKKVEPTDDLLSRAEGLRQQSRSSGAIRVEPSPTFGSPSPIQAPAGGQTTPSWDQVSPY